MGSAQLRTASVILLVTAFSQLSQLAPSTLSSHSSKLLLNATSVANPWIIPGNSPFIYIEDPAQNLFIINKLDMQPNPCIL